MLVIDFQTADTRQLTDLAAEKLHCDIADWEKAIWTFISNWFNPAVTHMAVYTSGSTGTPKKIEHSKQVMLASAELTCSALNLKQSDSALLCLPANKIGGIMMLVRSIHCKMTLHCIKPSTTPLNDIPDSLNINFAALTPMQLNSAAHNYEHFKKAEKIDKIILGGEAISAEVLQLLGRYNNSIYHTFGMTETVSHIALKKLTGKDRDVHYKTMPGIRIHTDENKRLIIEAPVLGQSYLQTNDLVRLVSENEFDWLGRTDNIINSGGVKINPEEIEQQLQTHIQPSFFIGALPDPLSGQRLVIAIEMSELSIEDKTELKQVIASLPKLKQPKTALLFHRFVRTDNGKTKREETLSQPYELLTLND
ncbi:MAG TPA: AMP-binding protein [Chitinophagales bacterium]|nr:AMP-binding protein [Chitinophagales bacterium]